MVQLSGGTTVVNHLVYDSSGQVTSQTNSALAPTVMYAGMRLDPDTGLYYDKARWYDAVDAVFASQDPDGFGGGQTNTEVYGGNSSPNGTDPSGCWFDFLDYDANKAAINNSQNYFNRPAQADPPLPPGSMAYYDSIGNGNGPLRVGNSISPRGQHFAQGLLSHSGGLSVPARKTDWLDRLSDFFAGFADAVSMGTTRRARRGLGIDSEVEYHSWEYTGGQVSGTTVAIATTSSNPAGWSAYATVGVNGVQFVGNASGFIECAANGDINGAVGNALGMLGLACRLSEACSGDAPVVDIGGASDETEFCPNASNSESGLTGETGADVSGESSAGTATSDSVAQSQCDGPNCFPAGTLVATATGAVPIEAIRQGNEVWAYDLVAGQWRLCLVLQTFVHDLEGTAAHITVQGETIESTSGHPFWVVRGDDLANRRCPDHIVPPMGATTPGRWVQASDVRVSDDLLLRDGRIVLVQAVRHQAFKGKVYNFSVAELESYAVGHNNVLVHNDPTCFNQINADDISSGFQNELDENGFIEDQAAADNGFPGIGTTENGGPDFAGSDYIYPVQQGQLNQVQIELSGSYSADTAAANAEANLRAPQGWSWHHLDDFDPDTGMGTVQLIQTSAHQATNPHFGGVGQYVDFNGQGYGR